MSDASRILMTEGDSPPTPNLGKMTFYPKDKNFFMKDSDGVESVFALPDVNDPPEKVCFVDPTFSTNLTAQRFNKIQDAINYIYNDADWYPDCSNSQNCVIYVYPGKYEEQLTTIRYLRIIGLGGSESLQQKPVYLYNTGLSESTYPIAPSEWELNLFGFNIRTELGGVYGKAGYIKLENCALRSGHFIETDAITYAGFSLRNCIFFDHGDDNYHINLTGTRNKDKWIGITNTHFGIGKIKLDSTLSLGTPGATVAFENTGCKRCPIEIGGDWSFHSKNSHFHGTIRNTFYSTGRMDIQDTIMSNGIHFTVAPSELNILNTTYKDMEGADEGVPAGEADITSTVQITGVDYQNNTQDNGISGNIQILSNVKKVGPNFQDSYRTLDDAITASQSGDIIQLDNGTFTGNFILPDGVNLEGVDENNTILTSATGTTLTLLGAGSIVSKLKVQSTPVSGTIDAKAIRVVAGSPSLQNCEVEMIASETYGNLLSLEGGFFDESSVHWTYTQTGLTSGVNTHVPFFLDAGAFRMLDSTVSVTIEDTDDNFHLLQDDTDGEINFVKNCVRISTASNGESAFLRVTENAFNNNISYSNITLTGPGAVGSGLCYKIEDDAGKISSICNTIKISGFATNTLGIIGANTTLKSHFDNIEAVDEVSGSGDYQFVNSPDPGDIRISGSYINMYDNDLVVAKSGGEFTTLKDALASITDNDSEHRYNIHIHSGFYTEDNPITLKPYVYISGAFKHNPRILPANEDQHLFIIPPGYCTCDIGEMTFKAPIGPSSDSADPQVYTIYAPPGSKPIMGLYQCLFLGDYSPGATGEFCNGFLNSDTLSGYHTVNCMTYGAFRYYANIQQGAWTDTGFFPEATSTMERYLNMEGEGVALVDMMRNTGNNVENLIYVNHPDAEVSVSDIYSLDQKTLKTGPLGGKIILRGSTLRGKIELDGGDVSIHSGAFEDDGYIEAPTGNLESLVITGTRNINTTTHCVDVTGGGSTRIYLGGGNMFDSPDGIEPIHLDGTFGSVVVEGVKQFNVASLSNGANEILEHLPDQNFSRIIQIQAYPSEAEVESFDFATEGDYIQEDDTKTDFLGGGVQLSGIGLVPYAWYHFNETTGLTVTDSSGNSRNGTTVNMANIDWVAGHLNNCLKFGGLTDHVLFANMASWERTDPFSLECWFYTETDLEAYLMSKYSDISGSGSVYRGYGIHLDNRYLHFRLHHDTGNSLEVYYNTQLTAATWYHAVVTYDGSSTPAGCHIYIDDDDKALATVSDSLTGTIVHSVGFQISGRDGANECFDDGMLDESAIYDKELNKVSAAEITYRYNTGTGIETMPGTHDNTESWNVISENSGGSRIYTNSYVNLGGMHFNEEIYVNTSIHYLISMDEGVSWYYWSGGSWVAGEIDGSVTEGNTSDELEALTEANWDELFVAGTLDIAALLETSSGYYTPILYNIDVSFSIVGDRVVIGDSAITIELTDDTHTKITNISGGTLTGIRANILKVQPY